MAHAAPKPLFTSRAAVGRVLPIALLHEIGIERIGAHNIALTDRTLERLEAVQIHGDRRTTGMCISLHVSNTTDDIDAVTTLLTT